MFRSKQGTAQDDFDENYDDPTMDVSRERALPSTEPSQELSSSASMAILSTTSDLPFYTRIPWWMRVTLLSFFVIIVVMLIMVVVEATKGGSPESQLEHIPVSKPTGEQKSSEPPSTVPTSAKETSPPTSVPDASLTSSSAPTSEPAAVPIPLSFEPLLPTPFPSQGEYLDGFGTKDQLGTTGPPTLSLEDPRVAIILGVSGTKPLDESTPQHMAMRWALDVDPLKYKLDGNEVKLQQRYILATIYFSLDGPSWTKADGYLGKQSACDWFGVTCDASGQIIRLELANNNLSGAFPSNEILELRALVKLDLSENKISGKLPRAMRKLSSALEWIDLSTNLLSGTVPKDTYDLVLLKYLNLSENDDIGGTISTELGRLEQLEEVYLSEMALTGSLPTEIGSLTKLETLQLHGNRITGTIPSEIGKLVLLRELFLDNNSFFGSLPVELGNLLNLKFLDVFDNELTGVIPQAFSGMVNLVGLDMHDNHFNRTIVGDLFDIRGLEALDLSQNSLSGVIPEVVGSAKYLEHLDIESNRFYGQLPSQMGDMVGLNSLFIRFNAFTGSVPESLCEIRSPVGNLSDVWADCDSQVICNCCTICT